MVEWLKHSCISIHTMTINDQPKTPPEIKMRRWQSLQLLHTLTKMENKMPK